MSYQKKTFSALLIVVVLTVGYFIFSGEQHSVADRNTASSKPTDVGYCLAIRGNGELEPAHWGGMAKTIEQLGLPNAMAGGSSASISMFWLNSVAQHSLLQEVGLSTEEKNLRAALLVKSFLGFFSELKNTKFSQDFLNLYGQYNQTQAESMTKEMQAEMLKKNYPAVSRVLKQGISLGLFDENSLKSLTLSLKTKTDDRSQFYVDELSESVRLFGKFDSSTDANLFFRAGLVSFENAAVSFGRLAAFYSATSASSKVLDEWAEFFKQCTVESKGVSWAGLMQKKPLCGASFQKIFQTYFNDEPKIHLEEKMIGQPIAIFPSTSVLVGNAVNETEQAFEAYDKQLDHQFGKNFKISNPEDIRFGYWGDMAVLEKIDSALDKTDEKSRRFLALGPATWKQVLSLSPAEPGLAPLKRFTANNQKLISAGGWSDLHPAALLKAAGCDKIVYLTRQGGESLFAQGVANRLMSLNRDVSKLTSTKPDEQLAIKKLNEEGDLSADPNGTWSKLFNMANPNSSVNFSLRKSSAVLCTNWNAFDVKNDLVGLVEDSYQSNYFMSDTMAGDADFKLNPITQEYHPGCQPR